MIFRLGLLTLTLLAAAAAAIEAAAAPAPFVITSDRRAGPIVIAQTTATATVARFGAPASRKRTGPSCLMTWPARGLTVRFLDFTGEPCTRGVAAVVTVTSRERWRTAVGLRVGDSIARLWRLYPQASRQTGIYSPFPGYWLVIRRSCEEVGGTPYPGLLARARNGRVTALVVATSACE